MTGEETYSYFEDITNYVLDAVHEMKHIMMGGLTVLALSVGTSDAANVTSYQFDMPIDKYEIVESHNIPANWFEVAKSTIESNKQETVYDKLIESLLSNGGEMIGKTIDIEIKSLLHSISELPIQDAFTQYDEVSETLFVTMKLPEDLLISATRYLKGEDKDLYFSVKGSNTLLFSGYLPTDEFVSSTFKALSELGWNA